ncbi:glycosyltransferase family 4 protein [Longilinea arvoryzae]|uniref:glycosyltransferase family 4 protein n=1 Tax=Longilinea arvoryzae TaxID=360412 RepID=UPI00191C182B|nr:glycosyltransferase family 4 protein [Longilinea arvoryzae]
MISTRFAGTDGVSLETAKWAAVLEGMGHHCFYFCGLSDRPASVSSVVPEAFYRHPEIDEINQIVFNGSWGQMHRMFTENNGLKGLSRDYFSIYIRPRDITKKIQALRALLLEELYRFARRFELELLIVENALAIPLNIPLGLAITDFVAETGYPVIAHHHDFYWERQRFLNNSVDDYLAAAFPPKLPSIRHVVLNSIQAKALAARVGVPSTQIPNVMDYASPPPLINGYAKNARKDLGLADGEYLILQPTRIIQRKGIEHAIELTRRLDLPARLVISHASGDEGTEYEKHVREFANLLNVTVNFESNIVSRTRGTTEDGRKIYSLGDIYPLADLVTYPSSLEGFGNAFLEAVYYKRPLVINNYSIFEADIKPKGFEVVEFDGFISDQTIQKARDILLNPQKYAEKWERNFELARRYYSYTMLEHQLKLLVTNCLGMDG